MSKYTSVPFSIGLNTFSSAGVSDFLQRFLGTCAHQIVIILVMSQPVDRGISAYSWVNKHLSFTFCRAQYICNIFFTPDINLSWQNKLYSVSNQMYFLKQKLLLMEHTSLEKKNHWNPILPSFRTSSTGNHGSYSWLDMNWIVLSAA